jgi:hypothetical protein
MMDYSIINRHRKFYIKRFVETFLIKKYRSKWLDILLKFDKSTWSELSAWDFWDDNFISNGSGKELQGRLNELANHDYIRSMLDRICVVLSFGHDEPNIQEMMLSEIINSEVYILEGIVIIDPMKLALVINHDGGVYICKVK